MRKVIAMNNIEGFFDYIEKSKNICLISHQYPDGDSLGSLLMLNEYIISIEKQADIFVEGKIPYNYEMFIDKDVIKFKYDENKHYDLLIVLDCGDVSRLGKFSKIINNTSKIICVDHHVTNTNFAHINIVDSNISSTGELLYKIFTSTNKKLTKQMAEYIYISIITDTGKFTYANTSSNTYKIVGELVDLGINILEINNKLYNSKPIKVVKTFIQIISSIEFYYNNKFGIAKITQAMLSKNKVNMDDIDGIVEFIREINEIEISCILKEINSNEVKVSLRSKNDIDVSKIAQQYDGGGHKRAAGFTLYKSLEKSKDEIIGSFRTILGD